jgi:cytidine deaminase
MAGRVPWESLFAAARAVRRRAHAPYSKFKVGAAVLAEDGRIYAGCNVENSSYGLSLCAERSALAQAVAAGAFRAQAVAIVTDTRIPCPPCGMCRQAMSEQGTPRLPVRARTLRGRESRWTLGRLLPDAFTDRFL